MLLGISETNQQFFVISCILSPKSTYVLCIPDSSSDYGGDIFSTTRTDFYDTLIDSKLSYLLHNKGTHRFIFFNFSVDNILGECSAIIHSRPNNFFVV